MKKADKISFISDVLDQLYPTPSIPLAHKDPYTLLVAVVLSAQCTDVRVNMITPLLFEKADNPRDMANLTVEEIADIIRPCGLAPMKSKGIHGLSQIIMEEHKGKVPNTFESLEDLPSVGHKTASVVMSQAFGYEAFPVDTHIHRLAWRWGLTSGKNVVQTEKDLKRSFSSNTWNKLHLQIIYFGREYCPARGHIPENCPICSIVGRKNMK
jgi:endonuclease III